MHSLLNSPSLKLHNFLKIVLLSTLINPRLISQSVLCWRNSDTNSWSLGLQKKQSYHVVKFTLEWSNIWAGPHFSFSGHGPNNRLHCQWLHTISTYQRVAVMCQKTKQGTSKKQGLRRLQATVAGSVTTDRSFTSKWKRSDVQKEEMHLDTFFGTQGYKTPLDWAFDSYRRSGTALL